ncbi:coiled-coil domain-containing protein 42 homolog [Brachyhypopomus gauderio]|uniref:coiled-coil domain-containing protein 42 homolog n=1 Tax=Brachyhypopomus gauderio TaxID=698409 RepID=UPI004041BA3B
MSLNLEDYFRTVFEEQILTGAMHEGDRRTNATRLLEKRKEIRQTDEALHDKREEFEVKKESFRQRRVIIRRKEEELKESLLKFDKFLKENDAKLARGWRKAEAERAVVRAREQDLQQLHTHIAALLARREQLQARVERARTYWTFLDSVLQTSKKFEDAGQLMGRFATLVCMRQHLESRRGEVEQERVGEGAQLHRYVQEQSARLLSHNNTLSQLQSQLDSALSQTLRWESTWNHIQATAAKETLLLGQIKVATLNLYHMTGGVTGGTQGVHVDDTLEQLEKIQLYMQNRADVVSELRTDSDNRSFTQTEQD